MDLSGPYLRATPATQTHGATESHPHAATSSTQTHTAVPMTGTPPQTSPTGMQSRAAHGNRQEKTREVTKEGLWGETERFELVPVIDLT